MNSVHLIGRLGGDATLKTFDNGGSVVNFSLATTETWKDKNSGEKKEKTDWHRCSLNGERGTKLAQYLTKGKQLAVTGSISYRTVGEGDDKRTFTDIRVDRVEFVGDAKKKDDDSAPASTSDVAPSSAGDDSDIPF